MQKLKIAWQDPIKLTERIVPNYKASELILLYSGLNEEVKNSKSYLAIFPQEKITNQKFRNLKKLINSDKKYFGYFSYEVAQEFEKLTKNKKSFLNLPKIHLVSFSIIFEFDHKKKNLTINFDEEKFLEKALELTKSKAKPNNKKIEITKINSNFSDKSYLKTIEEIKKMIADGDFYQTNLTRKFFGNFNQNLNLNSAFSLFSKLAKLSPANYSSFIKSDENFIISSSPELFLNIKNKNIISRPIKGTKPRGSNTREDLKNKKDLKNSAKERAENLMIVDLMRNDLSRICEANSIKVKKLFHINSYQNIHHMSSEIHGKISKNCDYFEAIKACFPAGSMTGAPKIKAMEAVAKKEKISRGIYSGAIGFISKKETNLSVVIRTLIAAKNKFEFQVGGGITFDSKKEEELQEIFNKSRAIAKLLNISFNAE